MVSAAPDLAFARISNDGQPYRSRGIRGEDRDRLSLLVKKGYRRFKDKSFIYRRQRGACVQQSNAMLRVVEPD
jgi:hypothetical protein